MKNEESRLKTILKGEEKRTEIKERRGEDKERCYTNIKGGENPKIQAATVKQRNVEYHVGGSIKSKWVKTSD